MTDNIQKLYEIAGVEDIGEIKSCSLEDFNNCENIWIFDCLKCEKAKKILPPFTAKKQLELIKWIAHKAPNGLLINKHITDGGASMVFDNLGYESTLASSFISFEECLAKLVNSLWQDLTEKQKQEIKRILQ